MGPRPSGCLAGQDWRRAMTSKAMLVELGRLAAGVRLARLERERHAREVGRLDKVGRRAQVGLRAELRRTA